MPYVEVPAGIWERITFDIIPMEKAFNSTGYITHIQCRTSGYILLEHHFRKPDAIQIIIDSIELIKTK